MCVPWQSQAEMNGESSGKPTHHSERCTLWPGAQEDAKGNQQQKQGNQPLNLKP